MDFSNFISDLAGPVESLARSNPLIALGVLLVLAFLIYRKPAFFLSILLLGLLLVGVFYAVMQMSSAGTSTKERLIEKGAGPQNVFKSRGPNL